jgi:hypothetical protein
VRLFSTGRVGKGLLSCTALRMACQRSPYSYSRRSPAKRPEQ